MCGGLRSFSKINVGTFYYKLSSLKCFCCINYMFLFLFVSIHCFYFPLISLTHQVLRSALFSFHVFVNFPIFFLYLIPSFITIQSKKILDNISIFFHLMRLVLSLWDNYYHLTVVVLTCLGLDCLHMAFPSCFESSPLPMRFLLSGKGCDAGYIVADLRIKR